MAVLRILATDWLSEDRLNAIKGWATLGLTKAEIAKNIGISRSLLYEWTDKHPEIAEALRSGIAEADAKVLNALYQKAIGGDTTAMIFWIKNRLNWKEKKEVTNTFSEDFEITIGGKKDAED